MKIINGGKKDYYDYLSGIYGIDSDVVYDRRKSHVFRANYEGCMYFLHDRRINDAKRKNVRKYHYVNGKGTFGFVQQGTVYNIVIEVGYVHYVFLIERYIDDNDKVVINPTLIRKEEVKVKKSNEPVSIIPVEFYVSHDYEIHRYLTNEEITNPIFSGTWVTSFISPDEMYNNIYNYLISIREPNIEDKRTDIQKLESKGFDKTTSFRNPIISANSKKK